MTRAKRRHGQDSHDIIDAPSIRDKRSLGQDDDAGDTDGRESQRVLEGLEHAGDLDPEVGGFGFFARGAPCHVNLEHVCEESLRDVQGEAAEEDGEHEEPFEVLEEGAEEGLFAYAVSMTEVRMTACCDL